MLLLFFPSILLHLFFIFFFNSFDTYISRLRNWTTKTVVVRKLKFARYIRNKNKENIKKPVDKYNNIIKDNNCNRVPMTNIRRS